MSALTEIEATAAAGSDLTRVRGRRTARPGSPGRAGRPGAGPSLVRPVAAGGAGQPRSSSMTLRATTATRLPVVVIPAGVISSDADPRPAPLRLTRRGRVVVCGLIVAAVTIVALLVTVFASGRAQATNHGRPGAGYQGMHEVVVQPGQTLWSIASVAEPSADPRGVIEQIMSVNGLSGPNISVGQELWVPR